MATPEQEARLFQALWDAFPMAYFATPGTRTRGGQTVVYDKGTHPAWYFPDEKALARSGMPLFDDARTKMSLMPDVTDHMTRLALRNLLADRTGLDCSNGVLWVPKAKEVQDRQRGTMSKAIAGWTLRNMAQSRMFTMTETDVTLALLQAIKMTNCACGRGNQRACPLHGDASAKVWR